MSVVYGFGVKVYRAGFDAGLLRIDRLPRPVIGVGNLTLGGTGKSVVVAWLVQQLINMGARPAILSRGYGARNSRSWAVVADREGLRLPVEESGDEPQMLARAFPGVPVLIGRNRRVTGRIAIEQFGADICVLDDSFQYWRLFKDLEILLINAARPLEAEPLFPRGRMREGLRGASRAHAAILTHPEKAGAQRLCQLRQTLRTIKASLPVAEAWHRPSGIDWTGAAEPSDVNRGIWLAVTSLGEPTSLTRTIAEMGVRAVSCEFPDHHAYTPTEIQSLVQRARREGLRGFLTTAKDAVKISPSWLDGLPCGVVRVELEFVNGREAIERLLLLCLGKTP